jgi:hypothetical protein
VVPTNSLVNNASECRKEGQFGLVKYNKANTNLQGNKNIIFRREAGLPVESDIDEQLSINSTNPCSKEGRIYQQGQPD